MDVHCCRRLEPAIEPEARGDAAPTVFAGELGTVMLTVFDCLNGLDVADFLEGWPRRLRGSFMGCVAKT